jgi:hypothetical protein
MAAMEAQGICPYCGEPVDLWLDESAGAHQRYVEDCPICCRPWQVEVTIDEDGARIALLHEDA